MFWNVCYCIALVCVCAISLESVPQRFDVLSRPNDGVGEPAIDWSREKTNKSNECMGKLQFHFWCLCLCISLYMVFSLYSTLWSGLMFSCNSEPIFNINFSAPVHTRESCAKLQPLSEWAKNQHNVQTHASVCAAATVLAHFSAMNNYHRFHSFEPFQTAIIILQCMWESQHIILILPLDFGRF